jgi:outer membrane receptor protein involved in Fe transport
MRFVTDRAGVAGARRLLACSASLAALAITSTPALADDDAATTTAPAPASPTADQAGTPASPGSDAASTAATPAASDGSGIIVTGSRLLTSGMESPQPVTAVKADTLDAMDPSSLIASVSQLPQFYGNTTPNNSAFFVRGGTGNLNLRGLGPNRTLTLLNGRRFPSSSAFGGVDVNLFPEAMVSSVETVTGGASAAYGTDAVAGVVNFKLNTKFEGLTVDGQVGETGHGDARSYQVNAAGGIRLGDRGHLLLAGTIAHQTGVNTYKGRDWYQSWGSLLDQNGMWRNYPHVVSNVGSFDGVIYAPGTAINGLQFNPDGTYQPFERGSIVNYTPGTVNGQPAYVPTTLGAGGAASSGGSGDDLGGENGEPFTIWPRTARYSLFAYADYEVTSGLTFFGQYVRGYNKQFQYNTPRASLFGAPTAITIFQDNAYLPDSLRQAMIANNIASFSLRRAGSILDIGTMRLNDATTQNVGTVGFDADINKDGFLSGWQVHGFYQYGRSQRVWDQYALRIDRIFAAVDAVRDPATGNIVCHVSLNPAGAAAFPGCQPLDLFGRGNASAGGIDYVIGNDVGQHVDTPLYFANLGYTGANLSYDAIEPKRNITTFTQQLAEASANGNLFDDWAGPVTLAFGASYRKESIYQIVQDTTNQSSNFDGGYHPCNLATGPALGLRGLSPPDCGNTVGFQFSKVSNIKGSTDVKEAFAETLVPLADDTWWIKHAAIDVAGRWANYSGAGDIWAYKAGLDLAFKQGIRLRGTYSRDVRAGNLSERFDKTGGIGNVFDPRSASDNPAWGNQTYQVTIFSGGNPNIKPEKADTFTAGVVFEPTFARGLSLSVDWYSVKIKDAIATVGVNEVAKRCLIDQDPAFCALVTTDPSQDDKIILVGNQYVNVNQSTVEGIDAEVDFNTRLNLFGGEDERLSTRLFASYLINRCDLSAPTSALPDPVPSCSDGLTGINPSNGAQGLFPKFKATGNITYNNGPFTWFTQVRYIGSGHNAYTLSGLITTPDTPLINNVPAAIEGVNIEDNHVPGVFYVDMRFDYTFDIGNSSLDLFASITNLFDKDPPITPTYGSFGGYTTQFNPGLFDVLGRRFTVGAKFKL